MSATPRLLAPLLVVSLFAGCALPGGGAGKAFDALDVPIWQPGYSWTYDVVTSSQASGFDSEGIGAEGDSDRAKITMTVINTTKEVNGEPVYVLNLTRGADHPLFEGDIQAVTKEGLELAATGYRHEYYGSPDGYADPCMGTSPLQPVEDNERFPTLMFPLDDGASRSGSLGFDDPFVMKYTMNVHGLVDVDTPAGPFKAVYVTTEFEPGDYGEAGGDMHLFDMSLRSEQWYSPDVQYLVKHVFSASATASEGGENYRFAYRTTAILTDYSLEETAASPAPEVAEPYEPIAQPHYPLRIVSDTEFPVNIADGPVTAKFALEKTGGRAYSYDAKIPAVDALEPMAYDGKTHEVMWTVTQYKDGYAEETRTTADILELELARGGEYQLRGMLMPKQCGASILGEAYGAAGAFWSKTFEFETNTGDLSKNTPLIEFPVDDGAYQGLLVWTKSPKYGYSNDQGTFQLRGPDGRGEAYSGGSSGGEAYINSYLPGTYSLSWQGTGLPAVGETFEVVLTVQYGYTYVH